MGLATRAQVSHLDVLTMKLGWSESEVLSKYRYWVISYIDLSAEQASELIEMMQQDLKAS